MTRRFGGEWETRRLHELADVDPQNLPNSTESGYCFNYIALDNVDSGRLKGYSTESFATAPSRARRVVQRDDILMSTVRPALQGHLLFRDQVPNAICSTGFAVLRARRGRADARFLFAHLFADAVVEQLQQLLVGSNYPAITSGDAGRLEVLCPPTLLEQRAIAAALTDVDELIESLEALIAKKRAIKGAAMQELLTERKRLPGFGDEWEAKRLGDSGTFIKGRGIARGDLSDTGVRCIRYGELYTRYENYVAKPASRIPQGIADSSLPIKKGDLLFAGSGETADEIGVCVAYVGDQPAYAGGDIIVLRDSGQDAVCLSHLLNAPAAVRQKARMAQGDAIVHIRADHLAEVAIAPPTPPRTTRHRRHPLRYGLRDQRLGATPRQDPLDQAGYDAAAPYRFHPAAHPRCRHGNRRRSWWMNRQRSSGDRLGATSTWIASADSRMAAGGVLEIGRNERGEAVGVTEVLRLIEEIPVQGAGGPRLRRQCASEERLRARTTCGSLCLPIQLGSASGVGTRTWLGLRPIADRARTDGSASKQPEPPDQPESRQKTADGILTFLRENPSGQSPRDRRGRLQIPLKGASGIKSTNSRRWVGYVASDRTGEDTGG